jgi:hypothetical protein
MNLYLKNCLQFSSVKKSLSKFINKKIILPKGFRCYSNYIYTGGNGGNFGKKKFKNFYEWNNNFYCFIFLFIILFTILLIFLIQHEFIFNKNKHLDEIVLRNCELIPSSFFCVFFKLILKKKTNHFDILNLFSVINQWYVERSYLFSSFKELVYIKRENSFQLLFFGYEPKIKNIIKSNTTKTKILLISNMLQIITGDHFKWSYFIWKEFCSSNFFANANFSTKLLVTKNENAFIDIYIDFKEENFFTVNPGITFENNKLSGIVSIDKKNIIGNGIDFNGTFSKDYFNDFFLKLELKKLIQPTFKISIFLKKINLNCKKSVMKIVKNYGKDFQNKIELIIRFSEKIENFLEKKNLSISNSLIGYVTKISIGDSIILPCFYLIFDKKNNYQPFINFDFKLKHSSKLLFLQKKNLSPSLDLKFIMQLKSYFKEIKKIFSFNTCQKKSCCLLVLNYSKVPIGFYLDFNSLITENFRFFFFIDLYKNLKKNKIIGKSIGFGFKFNNLVKISSIINSDGHKKIIIATG